MVLSAAVSCLNNKQSSATTVSGGERFGDVLACMGNNAFSWNSASNMKSNPL